MVVGLPFCPGLKISNLWIWFANIIKIKLQIISTSYAPWQAMFIPIVCFNMFIYEKVIFLKK
jgi:alpha-N-acetylglucosamine transferase